MLVHRRVTPSIKFAGTHLYTWVERGTVRVKCLAQEHNTMSLARPRTRTNRFGVERTNHEATAPPTRSSNGALDILFSKWEDEGAYQFFTSNEFGPMFARKFWIKLSLRPLIMTIMIISVFWSSFFSLWGIWLPHHTHQPHYD